MIAFLDQSGQPGGAELCLADISAHYRTRSQVVLLSDGPFAAMLRARGVGVSVLATPAGIAGVRKDAGLPGFAAAALALPACIHRIRAACAGASVLYLNTPKAIVLGCAAHPGRRTRKIIHLHDLWNRSHFSAANLRLLTLAANSADHAIANSEATAAAFRAAGGKTSLTVIPNGFDLAVWDGLEAEAATLRQRLEPTSRHVAAVFGRLARWKGQDLLLRAAAALPELAVWVVGYALYTDEDRTFARHLRELARDLRLGPRVQFLGHRDDIPLLMKAADVVVHCSREAEPFGRVVVEGMLSGRPVVASGEGGPAGILDHGRTGWLFAPGDASALAETLQTILADSTVSARVAEAGRAAARERFALERVLARVDEVVLPLLGA